MAEKLNKPDSLSGGNNPCDARLQADEKIHGGKAGWLFECVLSLVKCSQTTEPNHTHA